MASLRVMAASSPEFRQPRRQPKTTLGIVLDTPRQSGAQVVVFDLELRQPRLFWRPWVFGVRLLGQRERPREVPLPSLRRLANVTQPLLRVLSDGFQ